MQRGDHDDQDGRNVWLNEEAAAGFPNTATDTEKRSAFGLGEFLEGLRQREGVGGEIHLREYAHDRVSTSNRIRERDHTVNGRVSSNGFSRTVPETASSRIMLTGATRF